MMNEPEEVKLLKDYIHRLQADNQKGRHQQSLLRQEIHHLSRILSQCPSCQEKLSMTPSDIGTHGNTSPSAESEVCALRRMLQEKDMSMDKLKKEMQSYYQKIDGLSIQLNRIAQAQLVAPDECLENLQLQNAALKQENQKLSDLSAGLTKRAHVLEQSNFGLQGELIQGRRSIAKLESELAKLKNRSQLRYSEMQLQAALARLKKDLHSVKKQNMRHRSASKDLLAYFQSALIADKQNLPENNQQHFSHKNLHFKQSDRCLCQPKNCNLESHKTQRAKLQSQKYYAKQIKSQKAKGPLKQNLYYI